MRTQQFLGYPVKVQIHSAECPVDSVQVKYRRSTGEKIVVMDLLSFYEQVGCLLQTLKQISEEQRKQSTDSSVHWVLEVSFLPKREEVV